jgi:hypothetical protein
MKPRQFSLQPFAPLGPPLYLAITTSLTRRAQELAICYKLTGQLGKLVMPAPAANPSRRHGLWEETCFEFFLGVKGSPRYWEFNLSPAGTWNVYRFAGYRQDRVEEPAFASLPLAVQRPPDSLRVELELEIDGIVGPDQPLEIGIAAVIELAGQGLTYWALTHPGPQADFHRRDSFLAGL